MSSEDLERKSTGSADGAGLGLDEKQAGRKVDVTAAALPDDFEDNADPAALGTHDDTIIRTGEDASLHLLPIRDDGDPALTFRSIVLATALSCFQAVMSQIYLVGFFSSFFFLFSFFFSFLHKVMFCLWTTSEKLTIWGLVQTHCGLCHWHFYCPHCLLCGQRLGQILASR